VQIFQAAVAIGSRQARIVFFREQPVGGLGQSKLPILESGEDFSDQFLELWSAPFL